VDLELTDKVAIVTGGNRGIGKATARELVREGMHVAIAARGQAALEATAAELRELTHRRVLAVTVDTSQDESVQQMVQQVVDAFGRVDVLVNCAAKRVGGVPKLAEITGDLMWEDVNIKVMGYLRCAREVAPYMTRQGWGRIINISGMAARSTGTTIGSIRNVAVVALTKNLADELGPHGINVTVVHPGLTRTENTPDLLARQAKAQNRSPEEIERGIAESNSLRRFLDAQDVANVVTFLASPKSLAINGDVIAAGGGIPSAIYY
jgi:NAD(P)-dependent dehydrogenase (short-subunit alcohol dehydrogenase family)